MLSLAPRAIFPELISINQGGRRKREGGREENETIEMIANNAAPERSMDLLNRFQEPCMGPFGRGASEE